MSDTNEVAKGYFDDYIARHEAFEHFSAIKEDKRQRIITAALEEFATNDYQNVSTNTIVAKADISKGLLFRYFKDKAGLFAYLQTYVAKKLTEDVFEESDFEGDDIFETLKLVTLAKLTMAVRYPLEVAFLIRTMKADLPAELHGDIDDPVVYPFDSLLIVADAFDEARLKPNLDKDMVVKLVDWFCAGLTKEVLEGIGLAMSIEHYERLARTADGYFDFLRDLVYREQEPKPRARHFR